MKWIRTHTHQLILSSVVLLVSFFISSFCLSSDSFATSWSHTFPANSINGSNSTGYTLESLGFDNSFTPVYATFDYTFNQPNYTNLSIRIYFHRSASFSYQYADVLLPNTCLYIPASGTNTCVQGVSYSVPYYFTYNPSVFSNVRVAIYSNTTIPFSITMTLYDSYPSSGGSSPSGSLSITENGTYDVTNYAEAVVDVPSSGGGDYSDDLQDIRSTMILVPAVLLVIYFFYAIYKMIMGGVRR